MTSSRLLAFLGALARFALVILPKSYAGWPGKKK
jgi:hypothetical protein